MSFDSKPVWLITGTSSGLGRALVDAALEAGNRVVATLRDPSRLSDLQSQYPESQLLVTRLDVTVPEEITATFELIKSHFKRLDYVVNNAGYGLIGELEFVPEEVARLNYEVQFWGPVHIMQHAVKFFREVNPKGHGGRIFNISSIGGYSGNPCLAFYNSSKFALEGITEVFTKEMPPEWNIKAVILQPGGFDSEWRAGSMVTLPQHPIYAAAGGPAVYLRNLLNPENSTGTGDAKKMAQAIVRFADEPHPPLRLQLGSDSWAMIRDKAEMTLSDNAKWENVSHTTNREGIDGPAYSKQLIEHFHEQWKHNVSR